MAKMESPNAPKSQKWRYPNSPYSDYTDYSYCFSHGFNLGIYLGTFAL